MEEQAQFTGEVGLYVVVLDIVDCLPQLLELLFVVALGLLVFAPQEQELQMECLPLGFIRSFYQLLNLREGRRCRSKPLSHDLMLGQQEVQHVQIGVANI